MPVVLVMLTCTLLYHALKEWERNGGSQPWPQKQINTVEAGGKKEGYFFNRLHDGGRCYHQVYCHSLLLMTISRDLHATYEYLEWAPKPVLGKGIGHH